jgi:Cu/Ag efflux protein CusF
MRPAKIILASLAATGLWISAVSAAEQSMTGMVTKIDRLNGTIAIVQTQSGTVGANTGNTPMDFKVPDGQLLESVHAGDRVTFSVNDESGTRTITGIKRQ